MHDNWISTSALLLAGEEFGQAAQKGLRYLENQSLSNWDASQIAWALDSFGSAGLPANHPFVLRALAKLIQRHNADGSWASEDGLTYSASATVSALKVLKHYRIFLEPDT